MGIRHQIQRFGLPASSTMRLNTILAPMSVVMVIFSVVIVVNHLKSNSVESDTAADRSTVAEGSAVPSAGRSLLASSKSLLVTGVSSKIPEAGDYTLLKTVPWETREVAKLFRDAGVEMSCELLESGADVVQTLIEPSPDLAGPLGRRSAFSIRLQVGKDLGDGLPGVTRGIIEDYLKAHQLTIQTSCYHNEQGQLILSPSLKAAFVRLDSPGKTTVAESMIATSIAELRTLGAYWSDTQPFSPSACRTLILGFRYTRDADSVTAQTNAQREYEIVFLHLLPESTVQNPKLAVFATSDARTQFHLLEEADPDSVEQLAAITADVRFADVKLLGMYPETPVVTRVRHRALLSIPVEIVKSQIAGLGGTAPVGGFSAVLDELYRKATGTEAPPVEPAERLIPPSKKSPADEKSATSPQEKSERQKSKSPSKTGKPAFDA